MTIVETYGRFAHELTIRTLPEDVQNRTVACICDAIDCCLVSAEDPRKDAALASVHTSEDAPCSIWGKGVRASAEDAAFINAVAGAVSSRNDISRTSGCHPGSILIPAVLALAEEQHLPGSDIVCAVVAGYETMIRFGRALRQSGLSSSFRGTAMIGAMGTAVAAARVLGCSEEQIANAASFAVHSCFGLNEWTWSGTGEDVLQNGWAARNGVTSARLAAAGLPASHTIFEGRAGFLKAFGAEDCARIMTEDLYTHYYIMDVKFKEICACINVQSAGQTAADLAETYGIDTDRIKKVTIYCSEHSKNFPGCNNTEVHNLVHAIMSIQFTAASSMVTLDPPHIRWAPPYDERILALTNKCVLVADPVFSRTHYERQSSRIVVEMEDGTVYEKEHPDVITPSEGEVLSRFEETLQCRLPEDDAERLISFFEQIHRCTDPAPLLRLMADV